MTIEQQLKQFGLHKTEIAIYLHLLEEGLSTPPQIAKGTGIARTNCYNVLESLREKGLIEVQSQGKRKAYLASDPEALLKNLELKKAAVERLLPDLRALHTIQKNKPKIRFYDGWEQVKQIYWETLQAEEIFALGSLSHISDIQEAFLNTYVQGIKTRGIVFHDILPQSSAEQVGKQWKQILKGFYDYQVVPSNFDEFETDILIWDDNIAIVALEKPIFGTVITNPPLAKTFRTMFALMQKGIQA